MTLSHCRFMLIDDDETFTSVMQRSLQRQGAMATIAYSNAHDAIAACSGFKPSHILLDLNMPELSGLLALPALLREAPQARLVVLTGYSSIATAVQATKLGASNYLCKPANTLEILAAFDADPSEAAPAIKTEPLSVERLEWEHIQRILAENDGNVSATARALGMHRRTLQRKLQKRPVHR